MKLMLLALGVFLLLAVGEALKCHQCFSLPGESLLRCRSSSVECSAKQPYCGIKTHKGHPRYQQRGCVRAHECENHKFSTFLVKCCQSNNCNK